MPYGDTVLYLIDSFVLDSSVKTLKKVFVESIWILSLYHDYLLLVEFLVPLPPEVELPETEI